MAKQYMIAVSENSKNFITELCAEYPMQPGKTTAYGLKHIEAVESLVEFAKANRMQTREETTEDGHTRLVEFDGLALEVRRTLALRAATSRTNSAAAKLEEAKAELEELKAKLAKLQGAEA